MYRNPVSGVPKTPARAAGTLRQAEADATDTPEEDALSSYDEMLQAQLQRALTGETGHRQSYLDSIEYYKKKIAEYQGQLETGVPDDELASEWQATIDNLQKEIDASTPVGAGSLRSEQRQWQRQLDAKRQNLRRPIEDEIARYERFLGMAETAYDREYDEHGMRRDTSFSKSFLRGLTNPRGLADSFAEGLMDTLIGLPILAFSSPKLIQELTEFQAFIRNESRMRSEQAEVDAVIAAYGEGSPEHIQVQQNQLNARMAWMRENAPNLVPIFEYYNESLVSAFQDPETFAKTLEERPFDVYVHALDVIPGISHIIGGALQRGRMARRTATGRLHPSARAPSPTERIVRGVGRTAQYANPEELPLEVAGRLWDQRRRRPRGIQPEGEVRRPTAGGIPDLTPEQPTVQMRRVQGSNPDAPEWERIDDPIVDPDRNPFILADTPEGVLSQPDTALDVPDWEQPPTTDFEQRLDDFEESVTDEERAIFDRRHDIEDEIDREVNRQLEGFYNNLDNPDFRDHLLNQNPLAVRAVSNVIQEAVGVGVDNLTEEGRINLSRHIMDIDQYAVMAALHSALENHVELQDPAVRDVVVEIFNSVYGMVGAELQMRLEDEHPDWADTVDRYNEAMQERNRRRVESPEYQERVREHAERIRGRDRSDEDMPMSTGGDPARGDQAGGDTDNYRRAADLLRPHDDGTNQMLTSAIQRYDSILAGETEPTPFDPIDALRIQRNELDANNLDNMDQRSALWQQIGERLISLYDSGEIPIEQWQYLSLTEIEHFLEQAGRTEDVERVEAERNRQWNQRRTEGLDQAREDRIATLDAIFTDAETTGGDPFHDPVFFEELTYGILDAIEGLTPDYNSENLEFALVPDEVLDLYRGAMMDGMPEGGMREVLREIAEGFVETYSPEDINNIVEQRMLEEDAMFGAEELPEPEPEDLEEQRQAMREGSGVGTTQRDTAPQGFERTGETITADDLDDLFDRIDQYLEEEPETRTDDDDDWEEPPMTTGGDPAEGDQLGEDDIMTRLRRDVDETRNAAIDVAAEVLSTLQNNNAYSNVIRYVERLDAPTLHEMVNIINELVRANSNDPTGHTRTLTTEQINDLQPFLVAMNRHVLAVEILREQELIESGEMSTQNPFRAGNLSEEHFASDRPGTTRISERLRHAEGMTDTEIEQMQAGEGGYRFTARTPGTVRVPLDDTGERELILTGATGVSPETVRNALDVFEITDLMLVDEASGLAEVDFETFMNELNEILIPPEGATTTMNERLDALEAIEQERAGTTADAELPVQRDDISRQFTAGNRAEGTFDYSVSLPRPLLTGLEIILLHTGLLGAGARGIFRQANIDTSQPLTYENLQTLFDTAEMRLENLIEHYTEAGRDELVEIRQGQLEETRTYRQQFEQRYQEYQESQQQTQETSAPTTPGPAPPAEARLNLTEYDTVYEHLGTTAQGEGSGLLYDAINAARAMGSDIGSSGIGNLTVAHLRGIQAVIGGRSEYADLYNRLENFLERLTSGDQEPLDFSGTESSLSVVSDAESRMSDAERLQSMSLNDLYQFVLANLGVRNAEALTMVRSEVERRLEMYPETGVPDLAEARDRLIDARERLTRSILDLQGGDTSETLSPQDRAIDHVQNFINMTLADTDYQRQRATEDDEIAVSAQDFVRRVRTREYELPVSVDNIDYLLEPFQRSPIDQNYFERIIAAIRHELAAPGINDNDYEVMRQALAQITEGYRQFMTRAFENQDAQGAQADNQAWNAEASQRAAQRIRFVFGTAHRSRIDVDAFIERNPELVPNGIENSTQAEIEALVEALSDEGDVSDSLRETYMRDVLDNRPRVSSPQTSSVISVEGLRDQIANRESQLEELANQIEEIGNEDTIFQRAVEHLQNENYRMSEEIEDLRSELEEAEEAFDGVEISRLEAEIDDLQMMIDSNNAGLESGEIDISLETDNLQNLRDELESAIDRLENDAETALYGYQEAGGFEQDMSDFVNEYGEALRDLYIEGNRSPGESAIDRLDLNDWLEAIEPEAETEPLPEDGIWGLLTETERGHWGNILRFLEEIEAEDINGRSVNDIRTGDVTLQLLRDIDDEILAYLNDLDEGEVEANPFAGTDETSVTLVQNQLHAIIDRLEERFALEDGTRTMPEETDTVRTASDMDASTVEQLIDDAWNQLNEAYQTDASDYSDRFVDDPDMAEHLGETLDIMLSEMAADYLRMRENDQFWNPGEHVVRLFRASEDIRAYLEEHGLDPRDYTNENPIGVYVSDVAYYIRNELNVPIEFPENTLYASPEAYRIVRNTINGILEDGPANYNVFLEQDQMQMLEDIANSLHEIEFYGFRQQETTPATPTPSTETPTTEGGGGTGDGTREAFRTETREQIDAEVENMVITARQSAPEPNRTTIEGIVDGLIDTMRNRHRVDINRVDEYFADVLTDEYSIDDQRTWQAIAEVIQDRLDNEIRPNARNQRIVLNYMLEDFRDRRPRVLRQQLTNRLAEERSIGRRQSDEVDVSAAVNADIQEYRQRQRGFGDAGLDIFDLGVDRDVSSRYYDDDDHFILLNEDIEPLTEITPEQSNDPELVRRYIRHLENDYDDASESNTIDTLEHLMMQWREHLRELEEGDSDWEEPPGSLGGDPSRGDQAGEENQQRADTDAEVFQQDRSRLEEMRDRRGSRNPSYRELALAYDVLTHEAARVAPEHQATLRSVERHREIEDIIEDVWSRTGDIVETVEAITNFLDENEVGSRRPVMGVATAGAIRGDVPEGFDNFQRNEDFSTSTTQPLPDNSFVDRTSDIRAMYLEHMEIARGEDDDAYENSQSMLMDFVADYFNEAYLRNMNAPYNDNDHESDTSFGALGAESTPRDRFVDLFMDEVGFNRLEEASVDEFYQKLEELVRDTFEEFNITPSNTPDRQDTPGRRLERTIDGDYYRDPVEYIEENEDFIFNEDDLDRIETWQDAVEFLRDRLEGIDFDYPEGNRERQNLREQLERLQRALGISDEAMLPPPMLPNSGFSQANPFV